MASEWRDRSLFASKQKTTTDAEKLGLLANLKVGDPLKEQTEAHTAKERTARGKFDHHVMYSSIN